VSQDRLRQHVVGELGKALSKHVVTATVVSEREETAWHEAGHATMYRVLVGTQLSHVDCYPSPIGAGRTARHGFTRGYCDPNNKAAYSVCFLAGYIAQVLGCGSTALAVSGSRSDLDAVLAACGAQKTTQLPSAIEQQAQQVLSYVAEGAVALAVHLRPAIEAIRGELLLVPRLYGGRVTALVQSSMSGQPWPQDHLQILRVGAW